ncbi:MULTISPECIES: hypothetical protein [unclassified Mesorhizobium]|uniref:hypothetical protein n=1 Tax=unclassified Mesorhizobium TaxID=325217 RepID=UPI000FCA605C|nr:MULTISPECIES: hypothetical protein [unclassified Mesorhizobium]RUV39980.1 hypothetical protein EOD29_30360 [Mesorhizobium sp. M1A.T.Ca.IN.004.03.1.1]RWK28556.1 MAG: hypothetical protein EOR40_28410 [Mesorhizobium sp.]RWK84301.1 MAG: hypothetical protein EOR52_29235 [Mesorhizobium sp.]TIP15302.1 MAG: hypothetical protein E5X66_30560 [Mesorhizobium sp.]TJV77863.1 MAG: hypothetical protein E5X45_26355 [Mesorhizobium sp.]
MAITEPTIYIPLGLCAAYVVWRFFAPSFFMNREIARHARMDALREHERGRLAEALAPLEPKIGPGEIEAVIERYLDAR